MFQHISATCVENTGWNNKHGNATKPSREHGTAKMRRVRKLHMFSIFCISPFDSSNNTAPFLMQRLFAWSGDVETRLLGPKDLHWKCLWRLSWMPCRSKFSLRLQACAFRPKGDWRRLVAIGFVHEMTALKVFDGASRKWHNIVTTWFPGSDVQDFFHSPCGRANVHLRFHQWWLMCTIGDWSWQMHWRCYCVLRVEGRASEFEDIPVPTSAQQHGKSTISGNNIKWLKWNGCDDERTHWFLVVPFFLTHHFLH